MSTTGNSIQAFRMHIEKGFERWGSICSKFSWVILIVVISLMAYIGSHWSNLKIDTSIEGFLHEDEPVLAQYRAFQSEFSRDQKSILIIEGDIYSINFLTKLKQLHEELELIDQVYKVDSLVNARFTHASDDELQVEDLLEELPSSQIDIDSLRKKIKQSPLYEDRFINKDHSLVTLLVTPETYSMNTPVNNDNERALISGKEISQIVMDIDVIAAKYNSDDFIVGRGGSMHLMHLVTRTMTADMVKFSMIGILSISIILAVLFQRLVMVVLPVLVSMLSTTFTLALMAFFDFTVTTSIQILPSLLLAVGVGNSVHLFTAFFQGIDKGLSKEEAICYALGHSGLAIAMTAITTAVGLMSFIGSEIRPVADLGIIAPIGIMCAFFFSVVLLPVLIAIVPIKNKGLIQRENSWYQRFLTYCSKLACKRPKFVIGCASMIVIPTLFMIPELKLSHSPLHWFSEEHEFRQTVETINKEVGGASQLEFIFDTGKPDGIKDPEFLQKLDQVTEFLLSYENNGLKAGKVVSSVDIAKELNKSLHANDDSYYKVTDDKALLAQQFLLYEISGNEDLSDLVNTDFSKARMIIMLELTDAVKFVPFIASMKEPIETIMGDTANIDYTGTVIMMCKTVVKMLSSTVIAYLIAFCVITPLMIILLGSLKLGLLSMIPNLVPIILTLGLMYLTDIPMDTFTLLIGSIALGLAVDDTIHFMHNYQRFYTQTGDSNKAVQETLRTTGQALFFTTIVLSIAFFMNMFATMDNLYAFGLLTGFAIIMAFLADVLLAPAIVTLLHADNQQKDEQFLTNAQGN